MDDDLKAELTCPICMDLFKEPRRLPCGHIYCRSCLQDMLTRKYLYSCSHERILSCPECRQHYDLTFQDGGVDSFPRDFKLVRFVELYERNFCSSVLLIAKTGDRENDDETAVKTIFSNETNEHLSLPTERTGSSSLPSQHVSLESTDSSFYSLSNSAVSASDDSWIYVSHGNTNRELIQQPEISTASYHEQAFMPSETIFQHEYSLDESRDIDIISGHFENHLHEDFQRFLIEAPLSANSAAVAVLTDQVSNSNSSSETYSSDEKEVERDDDKSDDISGSDSEASSQRQSRRSRLSRFFRSLVLSDTDSYDDEVCSDSDVVEFYHQQGLMKSHLQLPFQTGEGFDSTQNAEFNIHAGAAVDMNLGVGSAPIMGDNISDTHQGASIVCVSSDQTLSVNSQSVGGGLPAPHCDLLNATSLHVSNESQMHDRNGSLASAALYTTASASGCTASTFSGRIGHPRDRDADESDEDYEPQTSMLRPKRKPRSRLKKFFTSLLSLSSSDEEEEENQVVVCNFSTDRN